MSDNTAECPFVQDVDIEARYLSGRLSEEEAEAFEAHYFACDRCFALVQRGADLRAAAMLAPPVRTPRRVAWWPPLAAAAGLIVVTGLWRTLPDRAPRAPSAAAAASEVLRGASGTVDLHASVSGSTVLVSWAPTERSGSHRVRLLGEDGSLLSEHEVTGTSARLAVPIRDGTRAAPLYVQVQALGPLHDVIAASPIVRATEGTVAP
jgi:anti-sigma factor RsiW